MPHVYQTNMCTPEIAQIRVRIIFKGIFMRILEYSHSKLIEEFFEKGSFMLPGNRMLYWIFFYALTISRFTLFIKKKTGKYNKKILSKYSNIFKLLGIQIYSVVQKSRNEYLNIFVMGK